MTFSVVFLNYNLDTGWESYGLKNTGMSRGTGISQATRNSHNSGIPEAQTFPARFPGNGNLPGISRPWFPVEHHCSATPQQHPGVAVLPWVQHAPKPTFYSKHRCYPLQSCACSSGFTYIDNLIPWIILQLYQQQANHSAAPQPA